MNVFAIQSVTYFAGKEKKENVREMSFDSRAGRDDVTMLGILLANAQHKPQCGAKTRRIEETNRFFIRIGSDD
jgi:hypothetical protein